MIADRHQLATMLQAMRDERPQLMTRKKYRDAIEAVGLTQEAAGVFFGWSARRGQAWANGEAIVPWPVQWCLEFMVEHGIMAADLQADA